LGRQFDLSRRQRPLAAFLLTDEAFGVASGTGERAFPFLLGVELSLFVTWNLATCGGFLLGSTIPDPTELGVDLIFPLAFLALLVPIIRTRIELGVAIFSGLLALALHQALPRGLPVLVAGTAGTLLGPSLTRNNPPPPERHPDDAVREVA